MRSVMCVADVYRIHKIPEDTPKTSTEKRVCVYEDVHNIELVCASARLIEAVESLRK